MGSAGRFVASASWGRRIGEPNDGMQPGRSQVIRFRKFQDGEMYLGRGFGRARLRV